MAGGVEIHSFEIGSGDEGFWSLIMVQNEILIRLIQLGKLLDQMAGIFGTAAGTVVVETRINSYSHS